MSFQIETLIVLVLLSNLLILGTSRLSSFIRTVAIQGALLGLLPLMAHPESLSLRLCGQALVSVILKAVVFPWFLSRAIREAGAQQEVEPLVGFKTSLAAGIVFFGVSQWMASRLPVSAQTAWGDLTSVAFFTIFTGLFIIISRCKAVTQVLGYLVLENGIYTFGLAFAAHQPLLVELGILLDVFMAVFVMGITIYHINREFDHIDTDKLSTLRDS